jgi:hypothetical protein
MGEMLTSNPEDGSSPQKDPYMEKLKDKSQSEILQEALH